MKTLVEDILSTATCTADSMVVQFKVSGHLNLNSAPIEIRTAADLLLSLSVVIDKCKIFHGTLDLVLETV